MELGLYSFGEVPDATPRSAAQATSAFYDTGPGMRLFRIALSASERLWPALAERVAFRLFLTPLPPKWLQRSRKPWGDGWRVETWPFEDASLTLYTQPVAPHGPVVLLVHGWNVSSLHCDIGVGLREIDGELVGDHPTVSRATLESFVLPLRAELERRGLDGLMGLRYPASAADNANAAPLTTR